jgi:hypothetical protein
MTLWSSSANPLGEDVLRIDWSMGACLRPIRDVALRPE